MFPSLILLLTLTGLSLDLASTRRILLHGNEGPSAAGAVIQAFGQFEIVELHCRIRALPGARRNSVSGGEPRGRSYSKVTARFTLDALPGKQMAIDADLNAGLINQEQAQLDASQSRRRRSCGTMDGAARFSQRDSVATILILAINIIAGFLLGCSSREFRSSRP